MLAAFIIDSDYPPAGNCAWRCWTITGRFHEETIEAHSWFEARTKAAAAFGVLFEWVEATRDLEREDEEHAADVKRVNASMGRVA